MIFFDNFQLNKKVDLSIRTELFNYTRILIYPKSGQIISVSYIYDFVWRHFYPELGLFGAYTENKLLYEKIMLLYEIMLFFPIFQF